MAIQTGKRINQSQSAAMPKARKSQISLLDLYTKMPVLFSREHVTPHLE